MTNQNVVVSDAKSGIGVTITVAVSNSTLFSATVPKPPGPTAGGSYISISRKKLLKKMESSVGAPRISASWVDSMRASSPTRSLSEPDHDKIKNSWILHHPSALGMFEQIISSSKGKQIVMFLDYDGTLSPIVEDPDRAFMTNEMREAVRDVAKYFPTAIVTGRCRAKVYSFVRLSQLFYAGSHGMDIKGPAKGSKYTKGNQAVLFQPAREFLPMIDEVYKALLEKTKSTPGAKVENNKFCVSVHFRCVDEKSWSALVEQVRSVINDYPKLRLTQGRKVLEIRPTIKWDKGKALEFLLESLGYANSDEVFPVYIGDDRTDEDAFKVLRDRGQGFGILVSKIPKETNASYSLQDPSEVYSFVRLSQLFYAGSHGMDIKGPAKGSKYTKGNQAVLFQPAREFLPMIDEVYKALLEKTKSTPGAKVENNKFCVSVHFRCVDEKSWSALVEQVRSVINDYPKLRLTQGRKVLEIRPTIKWDKGKALEFLLESLGYANSDEVFPVYIGDDRTDEDAFKVLRDRGQGFGILVSKIPKETNASYSLQDPSEVMYFLRRLVEWKQSLLEGF